MYYLAYGNTQQIICLFDTNALAYLYFEHFRMEELEKLAKFTIFKDGMKNREDLLQALPGKLFGISII